MAQLKDLIVSGSSRLLGTLYCNNLNINGAATFSGSTSFNGPLTAKGNVSAISSTTSSNDGYLITTSHGKTMTIGARNANWIHMYSDGTPVILDASFSSTNSSADLGSTTYRWSTLYCKGINNTGNISAGGTLSVSGKSTLNGGIYTSMIDADNANIRDTLRAYKYDIQNVADLGGAFIVAPTIIAPGSTATSTSDYIQITRSSTSNNTVTILLHDPTLNTSEIAGATWAVKSKIKISGNINSVAIGTCNGYINRFDTGSNLMEFIVDCPVASSLAGDTSAHRYNYGTGAYKVNVMLYNCDTSSTTSISKPVGIVLQSYGTSKNPYIDIWNGQLTTPKVRLGYLYGLTYNGGTLGSVWGLYADDAYLKGSIIATSGKIGGFDIGSTDIHNVKESYNETTNDGVYIGTDGIGLGKGKFYVTSAGALTASKGTIANWTMDSNSFYTGTWGADNSAMLCTGTSASKSIGGSSSISGWVFTAGANFGVTKAGALYANSAHINGEVTATSGTIGGCSITNGVLKVSSANITSISADVVNAVTVNATTVKAGSAAIGNWAVNSDGLYYSNATPGGTTSNATIYPAGKSTTISSLSSSAQNWAFTLGQKFGVTNAGAMYAKSGYIGKYQITDTWLQTGSGTTCTGIGGNQAFWAGNSSSNDAPFRVAYDGTLNATKATISGEINASSGTIGGCSITNGVLQIANANITGTIHGSKIEGNTITANQIAGETITAGEIDMHSLQTSIAQVGDNSISENEDTASYISLDSDSIDVHRVTKSGETINDDVVASFGETAVFQQGETSLNINNSGIELFNDGERIYSVKKASSDKPVTLTESRTIVGSAVDTITFDLEPRQIVKVSMRDNVVGVKKDTIIPPTDYSLNANQLSINIPETVSYESARYTLYVDTYTLSDKKLQLKLKYFNAADADTTQRLKSIYHVGGASSQYSVPCSSVTVFGNALILTFSSVIAATQARDCISSDGTLYVKVAVNGNPRNYKRDYTVTYYTNAQTSQIMKGVTETDRLVTGSIYYEGLDTPIFGIGTVITLGSECYSQGTGTATTISTGSSYATLKSPSQFGYPGTWQLVSKTMTPKVLNSGFMEASSSNVSAIGTQHCYISGKTITIHASFTRGTAHTDANTTALAIISPPKLGLSSICGSTFIIHGIDDGANGISIMTLTTAGALGEIDFISRATSIPSTYGVTTFTFTFAVTDNYIFDSACSEFHWKRIS